MAIWSTFVAILAFLWRGLDALRKVLHLIVLLFLFLILLALMSSSIPIVPHRAALVLDLRGRIVEQLTGDPLDRALGRATNQAESETRLRDVLDVLRAAANDDRIKVVVLDLRDLGGGGLSKLQNIGAALNAFRESGKKVIATGVNFEQAQYYLAAHADEVYLDPMGIVFVDGFEYYRLYMRDAIEKLGVDVNVFRVGTYKSFTENYTRNDMSPEEREESQAWLTGLWDAYQADVVQARGLPDGALQSYVNEAAALIRGEKGDAAKVALAQGLVTALKSPEQVGEQIEAVVGEDQSTHTFNAVYFDAYLAAVHAEQRLDFGNPPPRLTASQKAVADSADPSAEPGEAPPDAAELSADSGETPPDAGEAPEADEAEPRVADVDSARNGKEGVVGVIIAAGEILDGKHPPGTIGGDSASAVIREARFDDDIKAVVMRIDTPGGSIYASEQIYRELAELRKAGKPVIVSMSSTAASGGYYVAAAADEIWAAPTTITGSIGVFAAIPTFSRTLGKLGVYSDGVGTTKLSGQFRLERELGADAKAILQSGVENAYQQFLERVAQNRKKTPEEIDKVAQGRVWTGAAAKEIGLVDRLGTLEEAIAAAAGRAQLGDDYEVRYLDPDLTWQQALMLEFRSSASAVAEKMGFGDSRPAILRRVLDPLEREIARWARFNDPRHLYSYCFCTDQ